MYSKLLFYFLVTYFVDNYKKVSKEKKELSDENLFLYFYCINKNGTKYHLGQFRQLYLQTCKMHLFNCIGFRTRKFEKLI